MNESTPPATHERRLRALTRVATNLRWSWHSPSARLLDQLPGASDEQHPVAIVQAASSDRPAELADYLEVYGDRIEALASEIEALEQPPTGPTIAYFCPEFGIAAQVPQYSGGLGILAGDHLKAASDLGTPLTGIGLFYREGFFQQDIIDGAQVERFEQVDPDSIGLVDTGERIEVSIGGAMVAAAIHQLWVGATRLILLDTDIDGNSPADRAITNRLYAGDREHRLRQELMLGVGGVRALRALGWEADVYHLNEGHACFLLLELLAEHLDAGLDLAAATEAVRSATLFTTHTPVPAGIDRFDQDLVGPELSVWAERLGVDAATVGEWATMPSDGPDRPFNTAALALHFCGRANGVSQLHASVSRKLFASLPRSSKIEGITNGVHARTWVNDELQDLYDDTLGAGWENGDAEAWARVGELDPERFRAQRIDHRKAVVDLVEAATGHQLDPDRPIIGFARRFATYKRAGLMLRDPEGLEAVLAAGAQFVFAGKAHPADGEGKAVLAELAANARAATRGSGAIVVVPGYDITIAQALYAGSDVWLNNPIRPHEACGTSGEKSALNGGLNCSVSDGWWADWFIDGIGWVIPTMDEVGADRRDHEEAVALNRLLLDEVLPTVEGHGDRWWSMVTAMLAHLGPLVTAGRMVDEYSRRFYQPIRSSR